MRISDWSSDVCSSDLNLARQRRGQGDELGARAGVQAALVGDVDRPFGPHQAIASPRISEATEMYLRPASRAAATASATFITLRAPSSRISIGRLTPAITSIRRASISEIARLEGVPPNRSVSTINPLPVSASAIAPAM